MMMIMLLMTMMTMTIIIIFWAGRYYPNISVPVLTHSIFLKPW